MILNHAIFLFTLFHLMLSPSPHRTSSNAAACYAEALKSQSNEKGEALKYKLGSIASIVVAGAIGVSLPFLGKKIPALSPENDLFVMMKAFAAGVILATGGLLILPQTHLRVWSPCALRRTHMPVIGLSAMHSLSGMTMVHDGHLSYKRRYHLINLDYKRMTFYSHTSKHIHDEHRTHGKSMKVMHMHIHHAHMAKHHSVPAPRTRVRWPPRCNIRLFSITQILELGIIIHSRVIIGISLGTEKSPCTSEPPILAWTNWPQINLLEGFHQHLVGVSLGSQCKFQVCFYRSDASLFSLDHPIGDANGLAGSPVSYIHISPLALLVEVFLNSVFAGILIYMSLGDLLAADFMKPIIQNNVTLHLGGHVSLVLGAGSMSVLAMWA
uniref:Zinc transporter n=1 Tax=Ipomoea batatas TaxID=4120 RepID=T2AST3_IPOBA|nr:zinc transporter [Ipomoea batatas]